MHLFGYEIGTFGSKKKVDPDPEAIFNRMKLSALKAAADVEQLKKDLSAAIARAKDLAIATRVAAQAAADKAQADAERLVEEAKSFDASAAYQESLVVPEPAPANLTVVRQRTATPVLQAAAKAR
jgi:hypothetical protein